MNKEKLSLQDERVIEYDHIVQFYNYVSFDSWDTKC